MACMSPRAHNPPARTRLRETSRVCVSSIGLQAELPHPIKAAHVPHIQHERVAWFKDCHRPAWASSEWDAVTNRELLKLRQNTRRARTIEVTE